MSKKLKPLTIFLSDDELVNFKSHFDEFLNMNCDDKIKEQQQENDELREDIGNYVKIVLHDRKEIERLNNKVDELMELYTTEREVKEDYKSIIKEARKETEKQLKGAICQEFTDLKAILRILDKENKL